VLLERLHVTGKRVLALVQPTQALGLPLFPALAETADILGNPALLLLDPLGEPERLSNKRGRSRRAHGCGI
jgi:hypothetical protein